MNQNTNKIAFGLLTKEQQGDFSTEMKKHGLYEVYDDVWHLAYEDCKFLNYRTYRLKILPDEWYYIETVSLEESLQSAVYKGSVIEVCANIKTLRPAKPDEIPKTEPKEPTLLERIEEKWGDKRVQLLTYNDSNGFLSIEGDEDCEPHVVLQSMRNFCWYVYDEKRAGLTRNESPYRLGRAPCAVLFDK